MVPKVPKRCPKSQNFLIFRTPVLARLAVLKALKILGFPTQEDIRKHKRTQQK